MKLQEISDAFNSRYEEVFNRINKNMKRFAATTDSENELKGWSFDAGMICVNAYYKGDPDLESYEVIEAKYLENDEVFDKWLNEKNKDKKKYIQEILN